MHSKSKTADMAYIAVFAVLMAICSWISIPSVVPITLQTFAVFLAVGVLGGRRGTVAIFLYLLLGLIGIPVFAGFSAGPGVLLGNTGGYLLGFLFSALLMWGMERFLGKLTLNSCTARRKVLRRRSITLEIAAMLQKETDDTLDKVLFELSSQMKNAYSRSDA